MARLKVELKPCPFCGHEAEFRSNENHHKRCMWKYQVICPNCKCTTALKSHAETATGIWNTRASEGKTVKVPTLLQQRNGAGIRYEDL